MRPRANKVFSSESFSRYTSGAPDLGYYYDALDYTAANAGDQPPDLNLTRQP
jgi:hypothetical protein